MSIYFLSFLKIKLCIIFQLFMHSSQFFWLFMLLRSVLKNYLTKLCISFVFDKKLQIYCSSSQTILHQFSRQSFFKIKNIWCVSLCWRLRKHNIMVLNQLKRISKRTITFFALPCPNAYKFNNQGFMYLFLHFQTTTDNCNDKTLY